MSVEAISWVLNHAPVTSPTQKLVLIALANHAHPDGTATFPAVKTMMRYTALSERAIRKHLVELEQMVLIVRCDQAIVKAYIRRPQVPIGYDMMLNIDTPALRAPTPLHSKHLPPCTTSTPTPAPRAPEPYIEPYIEPPIEKTELEISQEFDLCMLLAELMILNGCKPPTLSQRWTDDMSKLLRLDNRDPELIRQVIYWSQNDGFWKANIHSPAKLRMKFDTLRLAMEREQKQNAPRGFAGIKDWISNG